MDRRIATPSVRAYVTRCTVRAVLLFLSALALAGCLRIKDSPAPGCVKTIGFRPMGGCFGRTAIVDLSVEPEVACLTVSANNCNGGVLTVANGCDEPLDLAGDAVQIAPGDRSNFDVLDIDGVPQLVPVSSNFSEYVPSEDRKVEACGTLGATEIIIRFTKTAPLCESD